MITTIRTALREAVRCLEAHHIPEARPAAEVLLADLLAVTRASLYLDAYCPLSATQQDLYTTRIKRRLLGEPVQYITGRQEFWSLEFEVNPHVLIPRPESELLVEHGVRFVSQWRGSQGDLPFEMLDVGTGSGNLAISLAHALPQSRVMGIDIVLGALQVAQRNGQRLGVAERLTWICGDLMTPLRPRLSAFCALRGQSSIRHSSRMGTTAAGDSRPRASAGLTRGGGGFRVDAALGSCKSWYPCPTRGPAFGSWMATGHCSY